MLEWEEESPIPASISFGGHQAPWKREPGGEGSAMRGGTVVLLLSEEASSALRGRHRLLPYDQRYSDIPRARASALAVGTTWGLGRATTQAQAGSRCSIYAVKGISLPDSRGCQGF